MKRPVVSYGTVLVCTDEETWNDETLMVLRHVVDGVTCVNLATGRLLWIPYDCIEGPDPLYVAEAS